MLPIAKDKELLLSLPVCLKSFAFAQIVCKMKNEDEKITVGKTDAQGQSEPDFPLFSELSIREQKSYSSPSVRKRLRWRWVMPSESCLQTSGVIEITYLG